jgi:peptide/nickel transport system permease protein
MAFWKQFARQILVSLITLWAVSLLTFSAVEILPQDPALAALGPESTPEQRQLFRERLHLNDPPIQLYVRWLGDFVKGNFGQSIISERPVAPSVLNRLKYTAVITIATVLLSLALALPLAIAAARGPGRWVDVVISSAFLAVSAVPEYVIAICLTLVLAVGLHLLPVVSTGVANGGWMGYILPILSLTFVAAAYIFRLARVSVIETLNAPYIRSAVLHGFSPRRIVWRHVLPNAGIVVVNACAISTIYLIGGVIVVENVFAYPGLGTLLVEAITTKDFPVIEAVAMVASVFVITINFFADLVALLLNPRLRTQ